MRHQVGSVTLGRRAAFRARSATACLKVWGPGLHPQTSVKPYIIWTGCFRVSLLPTCMNALDVLVSLTPTSAGIYFPFSSTFKGLTCSWILFMSYNMFSCWFPFWSNSCKTLEDNLWGQVSVCCHWKTMWRCAHIEILCSVKEICTAYSHRSSFSCFNFPAHSSCLVMSQSSSSDTKTSDYIWLHHCTLSAQHEISNTGARGGKATSLIKADEKMAATWEWLLD